MTATKPADRRQRRGGPELSIVVYDESGQVPTHPPAPIGLQASTVIAWDVYWTSPLCKAVTLPTDMPALVRLFRMYDDLERSWEKYTAEPEVTGSMGQTRISHFAKHIAELEPLIRALEDRFGLSPKSRLDLGVTLGDAVRSLEDLYRPAAGDPSIPAELFVPSPALRVPASS